MAKNKKTPTKTVKKIEKKADKKAKAEKKPIKKAVVAKAKTKSAPKAAAKPSKKASVKPTAKEKLKKVAAKVTQTAKKIKAAVSEVEEVKVVAAVNVEEKTPKEKASVKPSAASKSKSKAKKVEKKADDFEDDLIDDDFGESEIAEYEDDLKAVEDEEDEIIDDVLEDDESDGREAEVYLTDSEGRRLCRVRDCDQVAVVDAYCRYHYLLLWKRIQIRKHILQDGKLEKYIEDLTARYPDKFLDMIKKDMKSEKDFLSAIQELEIDESALGDMEDSDDDAQSFADEIRGVADAPIIDDDGDY